MEFKEYYFFESYLNLPSAKYLASTGPSGKVALIYFFFVSIRSTK